MRRGLLYFALLFTLSVPVAQASDSAVVNWIITKQWKPKNGKSTYTMVFQAADDDDLGIWVTAPGGKPKQLATGEPWGFPDNRLSFLEEQEIEIEGVDGESYPLGAASKFGFAVLRGDDKIQVFLLRDGDFIELSQPLKDGQPHNSYSFGQTKDGKYVIGALQAVEAYSDDHANCLVVALERATGELRVLGRGNGMAHTLSSVKIDGHRLTDKAVQKWFTEGEPVNPKSHNLQDPFQELTDVMITGQEGEQVSAVEAVQKFAQDLSAKYSATPMKNVTVDEDFKNKIKRGLLKIERGSVAVLGPAGSGKTTSTEAVISELIGDGDLPADLQGYKFLEISAASLASGTKYVGNQESKVNAMLELSRANKIVWLVDEFHSLRGLGTSSQNGNDVIESMKKGLTDGSLRMIGLSTEEEFWPAFGGDKTVVQRFTIVNKEEPKGNELRDALNNWISRYHLPAPTPEVLESIVKVSSEMDPLGAQPRKSVTLLEEIYAQLKLDRRASEAPTERDVFAAAQSLYGLDPAYLEPESFPRLLDQLTAHLDANIVGQAKAKKALTDQTRQIFAGLHDKSKPRVMALFAGPKGRGKTEMAIAYAKGLGLPFEVIEMNSYATSVGFDRVNLMAAIGKALNKNAFTVIVFDEIEKAPMSVQNEVLRMFTDGEFTISVPAKGNPTQLVPVRISARNASVILTTNAGSNHMLTADKPTMGFSRGPDKAEGVDERKASYLADQALRANLVADGISEFLLDRLPLVLSFDAQTETDFKAILSNHLHRALRAAEQGTKGLRLKTKNEEAFLNEMARIYYDPEMSNRDILRIIGSQVRTTLTDAFFGKTLAGQVTVDFAKGDMKVSCAGLLGSKKKTATP